MGAPSRRRCCGCSAPSGRHRSQRQTPAGARAGSPDHQLIAWRYLGPGLADSSVAGPYRAKRTRRAVPASAGIDGFATLMQNIPAESLRGRTIRLRGLVRATPGAPAAGAALWLRVDRPNQQMGFFDNMGDRLVRDADWKEYVIEGPVAEDAVSVAFGVMDPETSRRPSRRSVSPCASRMAAGRLSPSTMAASRRRLTQVPKDG